MTTGTGMLIASLSAELEFPISAVLALGGFRSGEDIVEIEYMKGIKAVGVAPKDDNATPQLLMDFDFNWKEDAWVFLGRHCMSVADVTLTKCQRELNLVPDAGASSTVQ